VPLDAFLDAQEAEDESTRQVHLARHARQAREHVRSLSTKDYQGQFKAGECPTWWSASFPTSRPACRLTADPELFDYALERNVCWSADLVDRLLRTMELGWRQERMVEEAARLPRPRRRCTGASRNSSATSRNRQRPDQRGESLRRSVASMEGRLLPSCARLRTWHRPGKEIEPPEPTHITVRSIAAPELRTSCRGR